MRINRIRGIGAIALALLMVFDAFGEPKAASNASEMSEVQNLTKSTKRLKSAAATTLEAGGVTAFFGAGSWEINNASKLVTGTTSFTAPSGYNGCYAWATFYLKSMLHGGESYFESSNLNDSYAQTDSLLGLFSIYAVEWVGDSPQKILVMDVNRSCTTFGYQTVRESFTVEVPITFTSFKPGGEIDNPRIRQKVRGKSTDVTISWYRPYSLGEYLQDYQIQVSKPNSLTDFGAIVPLEGNYGPNGFKLRMPRKKKWIIRIWTVHPTLGIGSDGPQVYAFRSN